MHRIYYHLYMGPSWKEVWAIHWPLISRFQETGLLEKLVVVFYGSAAAEFPGAGFDWTEFRQGSPSLAGVNEFDTLHHVREEALAPAFRHSACIYMHSKSSSSATLNDAATAWTRFLAEATLGSALRFAGIRSAGFNCVGANLAWGFFEHFSPPRLHFSGNFWCATRELISRTKRIDLSSRETSVRHDAEWWLSTAADMVPLNAFCTGIDHYADASGRLDWKRLATRLEHLHADADAVPRVRSQLGFLHDQAVLLAGRQPVRRTLSNTLLSMLPYRRWPRLFNAHDKLMRLAGSRKSRYFYCPEG